MLTVGFPPPEATAVAATDDRSQLQPGARLTVYGRYVFEVGQRAEPALEAGGGWLRLSSAGLTPCRDFDAARYWIEHFLQVWREVDGREDSTLVPGFGMFAGAAGQLTHILSAQGESFLLRGLDDGSGAPPAAVPRMSIFSLREDELALGSHFRGGAADRFAMGVPVPFGEV
jgi:hypothetical protein